MYRAACRQYRRALEIPVNLMTFMIEYAGYDDYLPCLKLCALAYDRGDRKKSEAWANYPMASYGRLGAIRTG